MATTWRPWLRSTSRQRRKPLRLIKVDYEELPAVLDPFEAMKEGAPSSIRSTPETYARKCTTERATPPERL